LNIFKRTLTFVITGVMLLQLLPAAAAAPYDNQSVLTSLGHSAIPLSPVQVTGNSRDITLTVPYQFSSNTVDLDNGLMITYNNSLYKNVVADPAGAVTVKRAADSGSGTAVSLKVTFNYITEDDTAPKSSTTYNVRVQEATPTPASFSGVIVKEQDNTSSIDLGPDIAAKYLKNHGANLDYVKISGSNPDFGKLMMGATTPYGFGNNIDVADLNNLQFKATGTGTVSYDITAYAQGSTTPVGTVVLTIIIYKVPEVNGSISLTVNKGATYQFKASDFTSRCNLYGVPLESVTITPANTGNVTWYRDTMPFTTAQTFTAAQIGGLSFKGAADGSETFSWSVATKAGPSAGSQSGTISVISPTLTLSPYNGSGVIRGNNWPVAASQFYYSPTTVALTYVKITAVPNSADGTLCLSTAVPKNDTLGYPALTANTALSNGAIIPYSYLNQLYIATKNTGKNAQVSFSWTATSDVSAKTAKWAETPSTYTVPFVSASVITYATDMNIPVHINGQDFSTRFSSAAGLSLSYVTFTLPDKAAGTLYLDYDVITAKGTSVAASTKYYTGKIPNLSKITFVPAKDYTGKAVISYNAYAEDGKFITGSVEITVNHVSGGIFSKITDKNAPILFDSADFQSAFSAATGQQLSYVRFSIPSSTNGILYYNYDSSSSFDYAITSSYSYTYYVNSSPYLSYISFVPANDYTGTVYITYTGYTASGAGYTGKVIVYVVDSAAGIVEYSVRENGTVTLNGNDFANEFITVTGSVLSYITIPPPKAEYGTIYYQYSADTQKGTSIAAATKYYNDKSPDISELTYVPPKDFNGVVTVAFTAYTASGVAYTGKLKFNVGTGSSTIAYTTQRNTALKFSASSFTNAFYMISGGKSLSYVTFTLPSSAYGTLYYNYTSSSKYDSVVTSGTKYYANSSPNLSQISFVPLSTYSGTFTITYTGYTSTGAAYTGKLKITVMGSSNGMVYYETNAMNPVRFQTSDFTNAFYSLYGSSLSYVRFTPPYSSYGKLYYNYNSAASYNSEVSAYSNYYVNSSPYISDVTFVPDASYSGELAISFTAYNTNGNYYNGTVIITVNGSNVGTVTIHTGKDTPVHLDSETMNTAFVEKTGSSLYSATFTLPASTYGILYYGYASASSYTSKVTSSTKYYRSVSPLLSEVTFVPASGYTGSVTIPYTGYTPNGTAFSGRIVINVVDTSVNPFTDLGSYSWADDAISYLYHNGIVEGSGGKFRPADNISRGDFTLMIARAFDLSYNGTGNFSDVEPGSYYFNAIGAAKALDIVMGSGGTFDPDASLTRQDAMVIIERALDAVGEPLAAGNAGNLSAFTDSDEFSSYAVSAAAALIKAGIITGSSGLLHPKDDITRAEMSVILYRILTM
jgi:hypothetical protein